MPSEFSRDLAGRNGAYRPADARLDEIEKREHDEACAEPDDRKYPRLTAESKASERERLHPQQSVRPAGPRHELIEQHRKNSVEAEGRHGEIVALESQRRNSDHECRNRAHQAGDRKPEPGIETEFRGEDSGRIRAQSIEAGVTERDLAAIADQHVKTGDENKIDQKARAKRHEIVVQANQRDRQQRQPEYK